MTDSHKANTDNVHTAEKESALKYMGKREFTVLLIGEIDCGKTAFMSLLVNLFLGNKATELVDMHDPKNESDPSNTQSRTKTAIGYEVTTLDGTQIHIIDTPGLTDASDISTDGEHLKSINSVVQSAKTIDAVLVIVDGTNEQAPIDVIKAILPRSIVQNIGFISTHASISSDFKVDKLEGDLGKSKHWLIQNPIAAYKEYLKKRAQYPDNKRMHKEELELVELRYGQAVETLNQWLEWLDSRRRQSTQDFDRLYLASADIEVLLGENGDKSTLLKAALSRANERQLALIDQLIPDIPDSPDHSVFVTVCSMPSCAPFCHSPCIDPAVPVDETTPTPCQKAHGRGQKCTTCDHTSDGHSTQKKSFDKPFKEVLARVVLLSEKEKQDITNKGAPHLIFRLVNTSDDMSLCGKMTDHITANIRRLEERKKALESKDQEVIKEAIEKLKKKLKAIQDAQAGSASSEKDEDEWISNYEKTIDGSCRPQ